MEFDIEPKYDKRKFPESVPAVIHDSELYVEQPVALFSRRYVSPPKHGLRNNIRGYIQNVTDHYSQLTEAIRRTDYVWELSAFSPSKTSGYTSRFTDYLTKVPSVLPPFQKIPFNDSTTDGELSCCIVSCSAVEEGGTSQSSVVVDTPAAAASSAAAAAKGSNSSSVSASATERRRRLRPSSAPTAKGFSSGSGYGSEAAPTPSTLVSHQKTYETLPVNGNGPRAAELYPRYAGDKEGNAYVNANNAAFAFAVSADTMDISHSYMADDSKPCLYVRRRPHSAPFQRQAFIKRSLLAELGVPQPSQSGVRMAQQKPSPSSPFAHYHGQKAKLTNKELLELEMSSKSTRRTPVVVIGRGSSRKLVSIEEARAYERQLILDYVAHRKEQLTRQADVEQKKLMVESQAFFREKNGKSLHKKVQQKAWEAVHCRHRRLTNERASIPSTDDN